MKDKKLTYKNLIYHLTACGETCKSGDIINGCPMLYYELLPESDLHRQVYSVHCAAMDAADELRRAAKL